LLSSGGAADDNESSNTLDNVNDMDVGFGQGQARAARGQKQGGEETSVSHLNDVELLTGLYFTKGERAQGISTGTRDGRLYYSTTINARPSSRIEQRVPPESESRKRLKAEYKCADCGTSDSPEWRKGPEGPKTLCNACGCKWSIPNFIAVYGCVHIFFTFVSV
jgi:DNA-directed RNA polymerase subunit RPC12/RpoP